MLLLSLLSPSAAFAHASLVASDPANDAVLPRAPAQLTLTFNEPVEPVNIRIVGVGGVSLVGGIARDGARLVFHPPQTLQDGAYVVSWRVISASWPMPVSSGRINRVAKDSARLAMNCPATSSTTAVMPTSLKVSTTCWRENRRLKPESGLMLLSLGSIGLVLRATLPAAMRATTARAMTSRPRGR